MSATLEIQKFCTYFNTNSVISIEGRTHPIEIYNTLKPE